MSELTVGSLSGLAANSYVIDVASGSTLDLSAGAVFPAGNIVQAVSATTTTEVVTTSTSPVTTNLTATITPSSASNKILVLVSQQVSKDNTIFSYGLLRLFRGTVAGTALVTNSYISGAENNYANVAFAYLDSPSTTSAQVYTTGIFSNSGSTQVKANSDGFLSSMVLLEVVA